MAVADSHGDVSEEAKLGLMPTHHISRGGLRASAPLVGNVADGPLPPHPSFCTMAVAVVAGSPDLMLRARGAAPSEHLPLPSKVCWIAAPHQFARRRARANAFLTVGNGRRRARCARRSWASCASASPPTVGAARTISRGSPSATGHA